jgi:tetratricopeptide (TPR) repeat protein
LKPPHLVLLTCAFLLGLPGASRPALAQTFNTIAPSQMEWIARARELEKRGDWPGLMEWGRLWTAAESDNALAWFVLGRAYKGLNRYPEAIGAYQQNLRIEPGDVHARNNLGNAYRDSKRYRDALQAYREAVRANPDYFPAWQNFGRTFYTLKGEVGVIDAVQRIRQVNPELARAWYSLMIEFYRTRNDASAREALDLLRKLKPEEVDRLFAILLEQIR